MTRVIDPELQDWAELAPADWPTLLLGNGLSINLWPAFQYASLFERAILAPQTSAIFKELGTTNFEQCLECLHHANIALRSLAESTIKVDETYEEVRNALFTTVSKVHVPWGSVPAETHDLLARTIDQHEGVFTTNYDLCLYWSQMQTRVPVNVVDYFWASGQRFDPADTLVRSSEATRVHYLHGGIHLWQDDQTGECGKWTTSRGRLLSLASKYDAAAACRPLFVSESTAAAKMRSVRRSSYLSFCLDELRADNNSTVVFGHALALQDSHIVAALAEGSVRRIAVSMFPTDDKNLIMVEKARILTALAPHRVEFFDSTTHPLGDRGLRIGDS